MRSFFFFFLTFLIGFESSIKGQERLRLILAVSCSTLKKPYKQYQVLQTMSGTAESTKRTTYLIRVLKALFFLLLIAASFIIIGRSDYWQGWVFSIVSFTIIVVTSVVFSKKTDLLRERDKFVREGKWWDKIFAALLILSYLILVGVAFLDAGRFHWSAELPVFSYIICYIVYVLSYFIIFWAMWVNKFFSSVVRIQTERGHEVIQSGPYRLVRHPGYTGLILLVVSTSLVLGSLWALVPAGVMVGLLVIRTYLEDEMLQKELAGYAEYAEKVKYRLLPGAW